MNFIRLKKNIKNYENLSVSNNLPLTEIEDNLTYYEEYYNSNITEYNKLVRTFPSNLIAMVNRYKEKPFFDGKDMTDDDVNDFKL